MRVIHVLRKPLSEGTVAANTLKHGTGGLNIDASRITSHGDRANESGGGAGAGQYDDGVRSRTEERTYGGTLGGRVADPHPGGRWPANVILQHLDGCRCDGVKRVEGRGARKTSIGLGREGNHTNGIYGAKASKVTTAYVAEDGTELVPSWICEPGCPVAALDEQSGVLTTGGKASGPTKNAIGDGVLYGTADGQRAEVPYYADTGGASRFYKQIGGKTNG